MRLKLSEAVSRSHGQGVMMVLAARSLSDMASRSNFLNVKNVEEIESVFDTEQSPCVQCSGTNAISVKTEDKIMISMLFFQTVAISGR